jgi:hypothetical protein
MKVNQRIHFGGLRFAVAESPASKERKSDSPADGAESGHVYAPSRSSVGAKELLRAIRLLAQYQASLFCLLRVTAAIKSQPMACVSEVQKQPWKARGVESAKIADMLAPPKLPGAETIHGATRYWQQLAIDFQSNPLPPIQGTTLGEITRELKIRTEAACQTIASIIPSPDDDDLSLLQHMQKTLSEKFPFILNVIINVNIKLDWVDAAPSPVHGIGVFAKKGIPRHTLVTIYPAHLLELLSDDATEKRKGSRLRPDELVQKTLMAQNPRPDWSREAANEVERLRRGWHDYGMNGLGGCSIYADPEIYSSAACGHKINDANGTGAVPNCVETFLCKGVIVGILTTCSIASGEELFLEYGPDYWSERHGKRAA